MRDLSWMSLETSPNGGALAKAKATAFIDLPPRSGPVQSSPAAALASAASTSTSLPTSTATAAPSSDLHIVSGSRPPVAPAPVVGAIGSSNYDVLSAPRSLMPAPQGHSSAAASSSLLDPGAAPPVDIPDRASTLSAPPDLEISSRSLFAFKTDYSGIFSDIRCDEHYESFYNNFPEKNKLPPPLDHSTMTPLTTNKLGGVGLRREDSDASVENLIFRESRKMRPSSTQNLPQLVTHTDSPVETKVRSVEAEPPAGLSHHQVGPVDERQGSARNPELVHPKSQELSSRSAQIYRTPDTFRTARSRSISYEQDLGQRTRPRGPQRQPQHQRQQQHATFMAAHAAATAAAAAAAAQFAPPPPPIPRTSPLQSYSPTPSLPSTSRRSIDVGVQEASWQFDRLSMDDHDPSLAGVRPDEQPTAPYVPPSASQYSYPSSHPALAAAAASAAVRQYVQSPPYDPVTPWGPSTPSLVSDSTSRRGPQYRQPYPIYGRENGYPLSGGMSSSAQYPYPSVSPRDLSSGGRIGGHSMGLDPASGYMNSLNAQAAAAAAAAAAAVYSGSGGSHIMRPNSNGFLPTHTSRSINGKGISRGPEPPDYSNRFSSFSDIVGRAEELARDQHGCRFLQTKLEEGNEMYITAIFDECFEKFVELMTDPFGNYLCQKLFEFCNDAQRLALVKRCAAAIPQVSSNMHGTRAVQRMVECLSTPEQVRAVCDALAPAAVALMKDINGNHVIQKCLHRMDHVNNQFVYDAVANHCFELATHRNGCCVMQRCMDYASPAQRNQLAVQIIANALPLVQNAFGNYVVQYVLDMDNPSYTSKIVQKLRGHLADLSVQKFSSNVVEKCLQQADRETRVELINELISDSEVMRRLLHDAFGNYVIQRTLQISESPQLEMICEAIRPHLSSLKQSPYGKRIQSRILKRMPRGLSQLG